MRACIRDRKELPAIDADLIYYNDVVTQEHRAMIPIHDACNLESAATGFVSLEVCADVVYLHAKMYPAWAYPAVRWQNWNLSNHHCCCHPAIRTVSQRFVPARTNTRSSFALWDSWPPRPTRTLPRLTHRASNTKHYESIHGSIDCYLGYMLCRVYHSDLKFDTL